MMMLNAIYNLFRQEARMMFPKSEIVMSSLIAVAILPYHELLRGKLPVLTAVYLLLSIFSGHAFDVATIPNRQLVFEDTIYFEIDWPESLRYTYKLSLASGFGTAFSRIYSKVELILSDPEDACQDLYNDVRGAVVLILRGGCSFLTKSKIAQRGGAVAAIVMDDDRNEIDKMIDMADDNTGRTVEIPSAFLTGKDGAMICRHLNIAQTDRAIINIPVNVTGRPLTAIKRPPWTVW
ncbi:hypothetical protein EGW08_012576 [Elysia chlorotica]|uniref:PA domain-containing protein n=1 Tax=Elysia chlorotica TaxID=188477 RepID=A0A433TDQ3_ELYCH|nr:hypothetical protein EGW08_012576 [Elysia chlorotica]